MLSFLFPCKQPLEVAKLTVYSNDPWYTLSCISTYSLIEPESDSSCFSQRLQQGQIWEWVNKQKPIIFTRHLTVMITSIKAKPTKSERQNINNAFKNIYYEILTKLLKYKMLYMDILTFNGLVIEMLCFKHN